MPDVTEEQKEKQEKRDQKCTLKTNAEYQKVVPVIMNLATASLVVPVVFAKDFRPALNQPPSMHFPLEWAIPGWVLLALSLFCGCIFHVASAKLVKALYGGYERKTETTFLESVFVKPWCARNWNTKTWQESAYERLRDVSVGGLVAFFVLGLICLVVFLAALF